MRTGRLVPIAFLLAVLWAPTGASAHGDVTTTAPAAGGRVKQPPTGISISFSEPPTQDSKYTVVDGCGDDVLTGVEGKGTDKTLVVTGGDPGKWKVSYNVISATDGHRSSDRFSFTVAGKKECDGSPGDPEESPEIGEAAPPVTPDEPASFPIVPVAIGGAIIVGAIAIRLLASR
jgi:methionine-rich copper-binding protein CopC